LAQGTGKRVTPSHTYSGKNACDRAGNKTDKDPA